MGEAMTTVSGTEPKLSVEYFPDTDTLVLTTNRPGAVGETVGRDGAAYLVAFTDGEGDVVGVTLEHAAELLRPYLCTGAVADD